jgi:nucleoside-diphosphate-sugar epimerase
VYNIQGLSFSPEELIQEMKVYYPNMKYKYDPDFRDKIAKTWPESLDDEKARKEWGWNPKCKDVKSLVEAMFKESKLTKY